ncbi:serine/threonine-protein kinase [Azospirillum argentinense]|uniref:non-specific serine/threonine protein kinase n=1 Tax=Azospirillum argentinense TaxID=2970906 RepID=A0A5B0KR68_9PROT|nr:serine/threonine-protein kinase [Azospirillum argentinense]KAA1053928.1 Serine/threonine-protein kinase pkn3 [Azospirillum argentinense]
MIPVTLPTGTWHYDPNAPLGGPGGFGAVFAGQAPDGRPVAVKRLHADVGVAGERELEIVQRLRGRPHRHVVPVLDAGPDRSTGSLFVVMARAESSLADLLRRRGFLDETEAIAILTEIVTGLQEVGELVHRDLKPQNILRLDERWQIADFGIARVAAATTAPNTLKACLSPPYGAPEQWRMERATHETDVYALGCIAVELLTGAPPFPGPASEDYLEQHCLHKAPAVDRASVRLAGLIARMLRKPPVMRPGLPRLLDELAGLQEQLPSNSAAARLAQAGAAVARSQAAAETASEARQATQRERREIVAAAQALLHSVVETLQGRIQRLAPAARCSVTRVAGHTQLVAQLGDARLTMSVGEHAFIADDPFAGSPWRVLCGDFIAIETPRYGRSASLWYADRGDAGYRWIEVPYFRAFGGGPAHQPCRLPPSQEAVQAASPVLGVWSFAAPPRPIDDEDLDAFCDRWMDRLAAGAEGTLGYPSRLPED